MWHYVLNHYLSQCSQLRTTEFLITNSAEHEHHEHEHSEHEHHEHEHSEHEHHEHEQHEHEHHELKHFECGIIIIKYIYLHLLKPQIHQVNNNNCYNSSTKNIIIKIKTIQCVPQWVIHNTVCPTASHTQYSVSHSESYTIQCVPQPVIHNTVCHTVSHTQCIHTQRLRNSSVKHTARTGMNIYTSKIIIIFK